MAETVKGLNIKLGLEEVDNLNNYLKGNYKLPVSTQLDSIVKRINEGNTQIHSWIDLFFFSCVLRMYFIILHANIALFENNNQRNEPYEDAL